MQFFSGIFLKTFASNWPLKEKYKTLLNETFDSLTDEENMEKLLLFFEILD